MAEKEITLIPLKLTRATFKIEGDDLCLNKTNKSAERLLIATNRKTQGVYEREHFNEWEQIITSIHWRDKLPVKDTNSECTEELLYTLLKNNAPCISSFGIKKSWCAAVTRNEIERNSTKFANAVNIISNQGLIPIKFEEWYLNKRLIDPKKGAPVTARLNHFKNWSAEITIEFTTNVYTEKEIMNIIDYAGFGIGIGSGRSSGYGRYKIASSDF